MCQSYAQFIEELVSLPKVTTIATDMAKLHEVLNELRTANGQAPLADISKIKIVEADDSREAIENLIHSAVMGLAMGNSIPFSDITNRFMVAATNIRFGKASMHRRPGEIFIDIELVHNDLLADDEFFKSMVEKLTHNKQKRNWC